MFDDLIESTARRGRPTAMGITTSTSGPIPSSRLASGQLNQLRAMPIGQVPRPRAWAASIRFWAARQQSSTECRPTGLAQIRIRFPAP